MAPRFPKIELKPCPLCGWEAQFNSDYNSYDKIGARGLRVEIVCQGCGLRIRGFLKKSKYVEVTIDEKWNNRVSKIPNAETLEAMQENHNIVVAKTIIDYFLGEHCAVFGCPLGRENGTGNCGPGWAEMTHSECINKIYEWFKKKVEE